MNDLLKGVIGGGWSLLVGWITPAAVALVAFRFLVAPQLAFGPFPSLVKLKLEQQSLALLGAAVVLGLLLAALQTPLYRVAEGYVGWQPQTATTTTHRLRHPLRAMINALHRRQLDRKHRLLGRLDLLELSQLEAAGMLREELVARLAEVRADPGVQKWASAQSAQNLAQMALLREQVRRYPVDDRQVVPTRLGNAIRRLEEYGYDRFRLDSQLLWYELNATVPEPARKSADQARTTVDFLVCLLYGNLLVALSALLGLAIRPGAWVLGPVAIALVLAAGVCYRVAVVATDDWAAAVRALVNLGRRPLASALGLDLPDDLLRERAMWSAVARVSARSYDSLSARLDEFRSRPDKPPDT
jgi:hypothetical protein